MILGATSSERWRKASYACSRSDIKCWSEESEQRNEEVIMMPSCRRSSIKRWRKRASSAASSASIAI